MEYGSDFRIGDGDLLEAGGIGRDVIGLEQEVHTVGSQVELGLVDLLLDGRCGVRAK